MQASIFHGTVVRGDLNNIRIGAFSSIQENCVLHAARYARSLPQGRGSILPAQCHPRHLLYAPSVAAMRFMQVGQR